MRLYESRLDRADVHERADSTVLFVRLLRGVTSHSEARA